MDQKSHQGQTRNVHWRSLLRRQSFVRLVHSPCRQSGAHQASSVGLIPFVYTSLSLSCLLRWSAPGLTKPSFEEAMKQKFKPAKKGESFGPSCQYTNRHGCLSYCAYFGIGYRGKYDSPSCCMVIYVFVDESLVESICDYPRLLAAVPACSMLVLTSLVLLTTRSWHLLCVVEFDPGCEAMIYTTDGTPLQGERHMSSLLLGSTHIVQV